MLKTYHLADSLVALPAPQFIVANAINISHF